MRRIMFDFIIIDEVRIRIHLQPEDAFLFVVDVIVEPVKASAIIITNTNDEA